MTRASSPSDMTIAVFLDRTLGTICDKPLQAPFREIPPSTVNLGGLRLPIAGGSYFSSPSFFSIVSVAETHRTTGPPLNHVFSSMGA